MVEEDRKAEWTGWPLRFHRACWIVGVGLAVVLGGSAWRASRRLDKVREAVRLEQVGQTYLKQGRIDQAERCWWEAERLDPDNAAVCLDLGRLAVRLGRGEEAVRYFDRALKRSPMALEPLYNLGQAYRILGRTGEAEYYRRLADRRRRAQPPRRTGMGADFDPGEMGSPGSAP